GLTGATQAPQPAGTLSPEAFGLGGGSPSVVSPHLAMTHPVGFTSAHGFITPESTAGWTHRALLAAVAMRRGQPMGPTNDQECEDFVYDALDLLSGTSDVEVKCEGSRITLSGSVSQKWLKRDLGEIAWAIPAVNDVQNNITLAVRRRSRAAQREGEPAQAAAVRKGS
ncbi:MAG: BON domain-containing protein, partial [Vicinamibacterales bacterium]